MKEELLHAAWHFGLFDKQDLVTEEGEPVEIIHAGHYNKNSGPDFFNARIRLGGIVLAGNLEIHIRSDDWYDHGHQHDPAYENVILHVVWETGKPTVCGKQKIPVLCLGKRVWPSVIENYTLLMGSLGRIPCENQVNSVPDEILRLWLSRMTAERLEQKADEAKRLIQDLKYGQEQAFFMLLAGSFGFHVNRAPFEELAGALDIRLFAKHRDSLFQIEALLFGRAGLLNRDFKDTYAQELQKEFSFLRLKYGIQPMNPATWKFGRTRPANFPSIRIAQLAALIHRSKFLMSSVIEAESASALRKLFMAEPSAYWEARYDFDKPAKKGSRALSEPSIDLLIVNTVAPFLYYLGTRAGMQEYVDKAQRFLESVKPEHNHITAIWQDLGFSARCAADSQGMIHLFRNYCSGRKCLQCALGNKLLAKSAGE